MLNGLRIITGGVALSLQTILCLILSLGVFQAAYADSNSTTTPNGSSEAQAETKKVKRFSLDVSIGFSSSLHNADDPDQSMSGELAFSPSVKVTNDYSFALSAKIDQDFKGFTETKFSDTEFSLRRAAWAINDHLGFTPGISWLAPTSTKSREMDSLYGSFRFNPRLKFTFVPSGIPLEGQYTFSYIKNFHEYKTTAGGGSNLDYAFRHRLQPSIPLGEKFALNFDFLRTSGWTYNGNPKNTFDIGEEFSFQATDQVALAVGHSNGGNAYKVNGVDPNVALFDEQSSSVYGSMSVTF